MPFKDIATADDSIFLTKVPPSSDSDARTALRRLVEVSDVSTVPFLPEEWRSAVKDGYLSDTISHCFKHGGLW